MVSGLSSTGPLFPPSLSAVQVQAGRWEAQHMGLPCTQHICPLDTFPHFSLPHVRPSVQGVFVGIGQEMEREPAEATIQNIPVKA